MGRKMRDIKYRDEQFAHRYDEHIKPINQLVDRLRKCRGDEDESVPYVAPIYGGVNARLLSILRDPGSRTQGKEGSGFLSIENDDATAEHIGKLFAEAGEAGIDIKDVIPWNAYPWYINNRKPKASELNDGVEPLKDLIDLLPKLQVVMLHGVSAKDGWKRFMRRYPNIVTERGLQVIGTYHPSRQAFWHPDPKTREDRKTDLRNSLQDAERYLQNTKHVNLRDQTP